MSKTSQQSGAASTNASRTRTFYTLAVTQTLSLIGSRMSAFAIALWVTAQTGSATPISLVYFFQIIPTVLLGNVAGLAIDRWNRRTVMMLSDLGQGAASVVLFLLFISGYFQIWHLYAVSFFQGVFATFQQPAADATVTLLVPESQRDRANAIRQLSMPLAGAIAPAAAGLLYKPLGIPGILIIDFITLFLAVGVLSLLSIPNPQASDEDAKLRESWWKTFMGGIVFLLSRPLLAGLVAYGAVMTTVFITALTLTVPYTLARTGDQAVVGLVTGLQEVGMLVGAVLIGIIGATRPRIHTVLIGLIAASIGLAAFGMVRENVGLSIAVVFSMLPLAFVSTALNSIIQVKTPPDIQGRVFAAMNQLMTGLSPVGLLLIGPLADNIAEPAVRSEGWSLVAPLVGSGAGSGMGLIFVVCGVFGVISTVIYYSFRSVRRMEAILPDYQVEESQSAPKAGEKPKRKMDRALEKNTADAV